MPPSEWELPQLKTTARMRGRGEADTFYAVQFYPYTSPGMDPVFAVTGGSEILICRPLREATNGFEVISWLRDDNAKSNLNSCAWTKDFDTGHPLICVAGGDAKIKVLDVVTGALVKTLVGHGSEIEDLAISPVSPLLLASSSEDRSIRFWTLDPKHESQPCACICAGEGHKETILTIAFHSSGRYILSGGMDCIWVLPDLPNESTSTDKPTIIHYPHFSTSAVHSDFVDCVMFHDDLILSKCAREGKIVLWRIEGFSSAAPPLSSDSAPTTHTSRDTRSAFGQSYQRLFQFQIPNTEPFYMRFGFFSQPFKHPILTMGNAKSKVFFWDFQQLEAWTSTGELPFKLPPRKGLKSTIQRENSILSTTSSSTRPTSTDAGSTVTPTTVITPASKGHDMSDPAGELTAHSTITIPNLWFCARQAAWSVGGEWMVVVGDHRVISVFSRWDKDGA